jgi:3',5'-cyclic AMP phosphodiesterase CpdA
MRRFLLTVLLTLAVAAAAYAADEDFNFVILGDRTGGHVPGVYGEIVGEINRMGPEIVVTVGDQIEGYTEDRAVLKEQWDEYWKIAGALEAPLYVCPGNHDIYNDVMCEEWKSRTDREPCYSFDYKGVHFVMLDTGRWETSEDWLAESGYREWLEEDLAAHKDGRMTVAIYHIPYWYETLAEGEADPLHEILVAGGVDAVFNGHFHTYGHAEYDGIPYTMVGSSGGGIGDEAEYRGAFFHYVWCTVRGDELSWAVLKKDSARPEGAVAVADLKTIESVEYEYVQLPAVHYAEGDVAYTVYVENGTEKDITVPVAWDAPDNWSVEPATAEATLAPGESTEIAFTASASGDMYPLPEATISYPYSGEMIHEVTRSLSACRTQPVTAVAEKPTIDGDLGDACWAAAGRADYFCAVDGSAVTIDPTTFYFAYDEKNLYVAARCEQEDMGALVVTGAERDDFVHNDDCVGFFLWPDIQENKFYQVYANADGVVYDISYTFGPGDLDTEGAAAWNGEYEIATGRGDDCWTFEAAIPVASLGGEDIISGDEWRINFRRKEQAKGASADWQYPIGFDPSRFGYLAFQ